MRPRVQAPLLFAGLWLQAERPPSMFMNTYLCKVLRETTVVHGPSWVCLLFILRSLKIAWVVSSLCLRGVALSGLGIFKTGGAGSGSWWKLSGRAVDYSRTVVPMASRL